jgi:hypothetical protein
MPATAFFPKQETDTSIMNSGKELNHIKSNAPDLKISLKKRIEMKYFILLSSYFRNIVFALISTT